MLPVLLFSVQALLTGGRFNILILICAAMVIINVLWHRKNGWHRTVGIKFLFKATIAIILVFVGFYLLKAAVGRTNKSDLITYITTYVGGSIQLLDMYLQDPIAPSEIWGKETFYALNIFLRKAGIFDFEPYIQHLEFRYPNSVSIGNVYTAYRRYIYDFGYFGMIVLQSLFALIYGVFYKRIKSKISRNQIDFSLLAYSMVVVTVFLHAINDYFFSNVISINYIIVFILLRLACWFIVEKRFVITWHGKRVAWKVKLKS